MISLKELLADIEQELEEALDPKDIPAGTSWKVGGSGGKGWAAKNREGKTNYWYGDDEQKNKENADKWRMSEATELNEEDPCWDGYQQVGMKENDGKQVPNCVPLEEDAVDEFCPLCLIEVMRGQHPEVLGEANYQGRTVQLGKPTRGDVKKFKVYVKDPTTGNIKKVNFGDKTMRIKKSNPARRKSFRARHNCENPGPKTKARYWSCKKW